jgi:hypothetical protein
MRIEFRTCWGPRSEGEATTRNEAPQGANHQARHAAERPTAWPWFKNLPRRCFPPRGGGGGGGGGRVLTTEAKAKAIRATADELVTLAKRPRTCTARRRQELTMVNDTVVVGPPGSSTRSRARFADRQRRVHADHPRGPASRRRPAPMDLPGARRSRGKRRGRLAPRARARKAETRASRIQGEGRRAASKRKRKEKAAAAAG